METDQRTQWQANLDAGRCGSCGKPLDMNASRCFVCLVAHRKLNRSYNGSKPWTSTGRGRLPAEIQEARR